MRVQDSKNTAYFNTEFGYLSMGMDSVLLHEISRGFPNDNEKSETSLALIWVRGGHIWVTWAI